MREKRRKKKSKTKKYQNSKKTIIPLSSPYETNALSMYLFHGHQKVTMHFLKKDDWNLDYKKNLPYRSAFKN